MSLLTFLCKLKIRGFWSLHLHRIKLIYPRGERGCPSRFSFLLCTLAYPVGKQAEKIPSQGKSSSNTGGGVVASPPPEAPRLLPGPGYMGPYQSWILGQNSAY